MQLQDARSRVMWSNICALYVLFWPGNLFFANIVPGDAKGGRQYACIAQNLMMRKIERGAFAFISPQGRQYFFIFSVLSYSLRVCLCVL